MVAGIFFWQSMVVLALLVLGLHQLPAATAAELFTPLHGALGAALMLAFPLRKKLWRPVALGWWDTPLVCRVDWIVRGVSGRRYGLYNDFLNPLDRVFGNKIGPELSKHPRLTFHCGETEGAKIAQALYAPAADVDAVKRTLGRVTYVPSRVRLHYTYLSTFLSKHNQGRKKHVVPTWLRAPGDQLFYQGPLERFRGQEPVVELELSEREQWFDGTRIVTSREEIIGRLPVPVPAATTR